MAVNVSDFSSSSFSSFSRTCGDKLSVDGGFAFEDVI